MQKLALSGTSAEKTTLCTTSGKTSNSSTSFVTSICKTSVKIAISSAALVCSKTVYSL